MKKIVYLILLFVATTLQAQVTIGSLEDPIAGSMLQLKSIEDLVSGGGKNCNKGIGFPRVELVKSDLLMPMYSESEAMALSDVQKLAHKGLVVYNVAENDDENFELGIYVWNGSEWKPLGEKMQQAKIAGIVCDQIVINGTYVKEEPLNPLTNTMILEVIDVERKGTYDIRVEALKGDGSEESNGYIFSAQGEFTNTGLTLVKLEGQGTPQLAYNDYPAGDTYDIFRIYVNGKLFSCDQSSDVYEQPPVKNKVLSKQPKFSFVCSSVKASTNLLINQAVNPVTDVISVRITSDEAGAEYHIYTEEVNGVQFEARGILLKGTQQIILNSIGTPTAGGKFDYIIYSNSVKNNAQCDVSVNVAYPTFTIQVYSIASGKWCLYETNATLNKLKNNAALFGLGQNPDAPIHVQQIVVNGGSSGGVTSIPAGTDMVFVSYDVTPNDNMVTALYDFVVNRGGFLIYSVETNGPLKAIAKKFGHTFADTDVADEGDGPNMMPLVAGNHLVNGMYQNLEGKSVGRDGGGNDYFKNFETNWIKIIPGGAADRARGILHKKWPVLLIGDGGFFSGGTSGFASDVSNHPCRVDDNGNLVPAVSSTWSSPGAYNSAFMVNLIMWAIEERNNPKSN
ncbi:MAG: hypothetical protein LBR66_08645 [Candidatus Symbiothrix sp.]|jgi:hypothetical protein|nr:hypothetical protein [Candidatus Symbiothrix sp.]